VRAVMKVNTVQAPKRLMRKPTRHNNEEGRRGRASERDTHPTVPPGSGDGTRVRGLVRNKGSLLGCPAAV